MKYNEEQALSLVLTEWKDDESFNKVLKESNGNTIVWGALEDIGHDNLVELAKQIVGLLDYKDKVAK